MNLSYQSDPFLQNYMAPSYPVFIQIRHLIGTLGTKKSKSIKHDLTSLISYIGPDAQRFALATLIEGLEPKDYRDKPQNHPRIALMTELLKEYYPQTAFLSYFPEVIASQATHPQRYKELFSNILMATKLPLAAQITMALSLYMHEEAQLYVVGQEQLERKLKEFRTLSRRPSELPDKVLDEILFQFGQNVHLQEQLVEEYEYLLEGAQADKVPCARLLNYFNNEWHYFATEQPIVDKAPVIPLKKSQLLRDLGPAATASADTLRLVLGDLGPMSEEEALECLLLMGEDRPNVDLNVERFVTELLVANKRNLKSEELRKIYAGQGKKAQGAAQGWNVEAFVTYCQQGNNFKWQNALLTLDRPALKFHNPQHFLAFMRVLQRVRKQLNKFKIPEAIFFKPWNHPQSQAHFLTHLFRCNPPEAIGLTEYPNRKIHKTVRDAGLAKQIWGHLDLMQLMVEVSDHEYLGVREVLELPISKYPDVLVQVLAEIRPSKGQALLDEVFSSIFPNYLHNHSNNIRLLQNLWEANQDLVISCICELYKAESKKENSLNLSRVLDIAQVIKESLIPLTNWNDYDFAVPLAILAGKRQFLHFEPWINDRIKNAGNPFLRAILQYIEDHLLVPIRKYAEHGQTISYEVVLEKAQLSKELLAFIFESIFLTTSSSKMTKRNLESLKRIYKEVCTYFPEMSESQMPDEIEQQAERQFIKIYKKEVTIEAAIEHMKRLKASAKPQEKELFASMVTFMYSELRFHISYPENELMITADLFAGIVNHALIDKKLVQVLLQVLEDDLRQDNKKYFFARLVIDKIKPKLAQEGDFCEKLLEVPLVMQKDPEMVEGLLRGVEPPIKLGVQKEKRLREAIKLKNSPPEPIILVGGGEEEVEEKKTESLDYDILSQLDRSKAISQSLGERDNRLTKINTICNTLSLSNIDDKAKDLQKIMDTKAATLLLAYNIVFKRIPLAAPNNAGVEIFYRLTQKLPNIQAPVRRLTYKILQAWFRLTEKSVNDKNLNNFKSLGFWLGKLTIAKGMPILIHKINIREILVSSYNVHTCRLSLNVSVILRMLEHITIHKEVFRVNNPWLGRILSTFREVEEKLKEEHSTTKSEIKAFFLSSDLKKGRELSQTNFLDRNEAPIISRLPDYVIVPPEMYNYYKNNKGLDLKMVIAKAVDDSIQEIVEPVIDRAVKIAIVTTKQLIMKDFAFEANADRFKNSFSNVVKKLAGPLAQVTSREPLKNSMNKILKNILAQHLSEQTEVDGIITKVIPDHLDLGCALIKKAVIESAEQAIRKDENINAAIDQRVTATTGNKPFKDEAYLREIPDIVPEELRPKVGGLSLEEFLIYDEFRKEKEPAVERLQKVSQADRLWELLAEKGNPKSMREVLQVQPGLKEELMNRVFSLLGEVKEEADVEYYLQVCELLREAVDPAEAWTVFKEKTDIGRKEVSNVVRRLVREGVLEEACLSELKEGNEEEQRAISMFQKWLDTAREEIEPFLQSLQEIFNKSQNQIRTFFEHSLNYALQKAQQSQSAYHLSLDTTYIEDYSKLIIISYKLIASNNSNIFLEHTLAAILTVFGRVFAKEAPAHHQRPFFKLFLNLICDTTRKEYDFQADKVTAFYYILGRELHKISPAQYPNFAFAWTELVTNKSFMPTLLSRYEYWDVYFELVCDLFRFAREYLTEEGLNDHPPCQLFYKGLLRTVIILIHDFPDFLSAFSLQLVLAIPDKYLQIKNIVLSAYPRELKFRSPKAISNREELDKESRVNNLPRYYRLRFDKPKYNHFISLFQNNDKSLRSKLEAENDETLQLFVLYFAWLEECQLSVTNSRKLLMDIIISLEGELKEKLIRFALNLVRYPNSITCFFIDFITTMVFKSNSEKTRNLLLAKIFERINIESAHPWGMLYLTNQFQTQKNELTKLQIPKDILSRL